MRPWAAPPRMRMWEPFMRPLTSERRLSTASDIADEDIGSHIHLHFRETSSSSLAGGH